MIIHESMHIKITVHIKTWKSRRKYFRPHPEGMSSAMAKIDWIDGDVYSAKNYMIPHMVRFFWLWWILSIEFKRRFMSEQKLVKYEATHLFMIEEAQKNKSL